MSSFWGAGGEGPPVALHGLLPVRDSDFRGASGYTTVHVSDRSVALVLEELTYLWSSLGPSPPHAQQPTLVSSAASMLAGTFEAVVREAGPQRWERLPSPERIEKLQAWLREVLKDLRDDSSKLRWRFRRAWEVAPELMLGVDFDVLNIDAVASVVEADLTRLDSMSEDSRARSTSAPRRREVGALIERYLHPSHGREEWIYLVEAVRAGAEDLPSLDEVYGRRETSLDPAPFVLVVYDAMCPGLARELVRCCTPGTSNLELLREAVSGWRGLHESVPRRDDGLRAAQSRREALWTLLRTLSVSGRTLESMWGRWAEVRKEVRLDHLRLLHGLIEVPRLDDRKRPMAVPPCSPARFNFAPEVPGETRWVEPLLHAVRHALPRRLIATVRVDSPPAAPDLTLSAFLDEAEPLLPPARPSTRGPRPMSNRDALRAIIQKFRRGCAWKALPQGSTLHRRFQLWGYRLRRKLAELAVAHRVLTPGQARRLA